MSRLDNLLAFLSWLDWRGAQDATPGIELISSEKDAGENEPKEWNCEELLG